MSLLVAPSEPESLRALGTYSPLCEQYGADILYLTANGELAGVQRKTIDDLVSSLGERLNRELAKMTPLDIRVLLIEGQWMWTADGTSLGLGKYGARAFTRTSYNGFVLSVQQLGVWVVNTDHLSHTLEWVVQAGTWFDKRDHVSLSVRGNGPRDLFGGRDHTYQRLWLWQSFEGIGAVQAKELDSYFGGVFPAVWTMTREEWMAMAKPDGCKGIGKKRAQALWDALGDARAKYDLPGSKKGEVK